VIFAGNSNLNSNNSDLEHLERRSSALYTLATRSHVAHGNIMSTALRACSGPHLAAIEKL
jgi:hypothetical protein